MAGLGTWERFRERHTSLRGGLACVARISRSVYAGLLVLYRTIDFPMELWFPCTWCAVRCSFIFYISTLHDMGGAVGALICSVSVWRFELDWVEYNYNCG